MTGIGEIPGKGVYVCSNCQQAIPINDENAILAACPSCGESDFISVLQDHASVPPNVEDPAKVVVS